MAGGFERKMLCYVRELSVVKALSNFYYNFVCVLFVFTLNYLHIGCSLILCSLSILAFLGCGS